MDTIRIQGGIALQGKVRIQGSKNAALPILAATLLNGETSYIGNCPRIADVYAMAELLRQLGCVVNWRENGLEVDSSGMQDIAICSEAVKGMRSSLCLLGAVLGRCGQVVMEHPGGCVIGARPIDLHIEALRQMGAEFCEEDGLLCARADRLHGAEIFMRRQSVGATENVILAAVMAEGDTLLHGAACEPEITSLCRYLQNCGAVIEGIGTDYLGICGGRRLCGADFVIPSDRIVAGTYLLAGIGTGGSIFLENAPADQLEAVIGLAEQMGGRACIAEDGIYVQGPDRPLAVEQIRTAPYPGFPTDLQSPALAVETLGDGMTLVEESIFENRFRVVEELHRMGAAAEQLDANRVLVRGVRRLQGTGVQARELRGGAALVVAGLMAEGRTQISNCHYIYRGYENICRDLRELGARIVSV